MYKSKTMIAVPPGYTIKEQIDSRGLKQKEFAERMELSEKHISKLLNGEVLLTTDMALRLEMVLGISAKFWINLEAIYREKIAKIELENNLDEDEELLAKFPYKKMADLNWVKKTSSKIERVYNLRQFFEVNRLGLLLENKKINVLYRRVNNNEVSDYALMVWAQKAKLESRNIKTSPINIRGLIKYLPEFRKMTSKNPDIFCDDLIKMLASKGIALVFLPHIGGSFLHGATFYNGNKIVIGLTVRGKDADKFWFSFFHELGHIILGHINKDYDNEMENAANEYAKETLINTNDYISFISKNEFTEKAIISFARKIDIDTGIVVGRLQKDGYIPYNMFNNLKTKYAIL